MRKNNQSGRSMVEMLGVLAIIGVLSVGAIAGYSKAMMKYKLNKHTEQVSSILDYIHIHLDEFKRNKKEINHDMVPFLIKLGVIPKEMKQIGRNEVEDVFSNTIFIQNYSSESIYHLELIVMFKNNNDTEICMNLFQLAKLRSKNLYEVVYDNWNGATPQRVVYYGDNYCNNGSSCLNKISLNDMDVACNRCKENCAFYFVDKL